MSGSLQQLLLSGRLLDWILGLMLLEAAVLLLWRRRASGRGVVSLALTLASGAALMLALRGALMQSGFVSIALPLLAALLAHLGDLWARWRD